MALDRVNNTRFHSDKDQSRKTAKAQLEFIWSQFDAFRKKANEKQISAFHNFVNIEKSGEPFTGGQLSYIDDLYEKTMAGLGLPSYKGIKSKYGVNLKP